MTWASGSSASRRAASRPVDEPDPRLELGGAGGVQHDVVHAPVVRDDGQAALGDDEQHRDVGAGGADQPAQVARVGELEPAVDEQQVGVGRLEQGAALGGQDLAPGGRAGPARAGPRPRAAARWSAAAGCSWCLRGSDGCWARSGLGRPWPMGKDNEPWRRPRTRARLRRSRCATGRRPGRGGGRRGRRAGRRAGDARRAPRSRGRPAPRHPSDAVLGVCSVLVGDRPVGSRDPGSRRTTGDTVEFLPPFAGG